MKALQTLPNRKWVLELSRIFQVSGGQTIPVRVRYEYVICDVTQHYSTTARYNTCSNYTITLACIGFVTGSS